MTTNWSIACEGYDLTDIAREVLNFEMSSRGLKISLTLQSPADEGREPLPPANDGFVPDDQEPTRVHIAHTVEEMQGILNHGRL